MHLLIDGQALQTSTSRQRGIGRYASNLLRALAAARPEWRIEIVQNGSLPPISPEDRPDRPLLSFAPPQRNTGRRDELNERYYADWLSARRPDAVLLLSHFENWEAVVPSFCGARPRVLGIAYDLIPLLFPEQYLTDFGTAHWYAHRFRQFLQSDALLAISEATAQDVRILGEEEAPPVVNVGGAVDPFFAPLSAREIAAHAGRVRRRFALHRDYLLYVGAADYRKNLHGAIRAFGALPAAWRTALDLVLVCRLKSAERAAVEESARRAGVAGQLRLIASADDDELRTLYQTCRLFFFPSLYEGLGLPVLEALHCGAPVVTSHCSALLEYAGPVSWFADPASPAALAQVLEQALAEPRDRRRAEREAFARTFTWTKTAERACAVIEKTVKQPPAAPARRRRLAWIASLPAPPERAEYDRSVLASLTERFEVEIVVLPDPLEAPATLARRYLILAAEELYARHAASPYDLFVYQASCSPWPPALRDLFAQFPGPALPRRSSPTNPDYFIYRIESALQHREQSDIIWRGFAVRCLADCRENRDEILASWAELRARGQG